MVEEVAAIFILHSVRAKVQRVTQTSLLLCSLLVARHSGLLEKLLEDLRGYLVQTSGAGAADQARRHGSAVLQQRLRP